jgi:hypothetical protein
MKMKVHDYAILDGALLKQKQMTMLYGYKPNIFVVKDKAGRKHYTIVESEQLRGIL